MVYRRHFRDQGGRNHEARTKVVELDGIGLCKNGSYPHYQTFKLFSIGAEVPKDFKRVLAAVGKLKQAQPGFVRRPEYLPAHFRTVVVKNGYQARFMSFIEEVAICVLLHFKEKGYS
jgi:hypothetical protein